MPPSGHVTSMRCKWSRLDSETINLDIVRREAKRCDSKTRVFNVEKRMNNAGSSGEKPAGRRLFSEGDANDVPVPFQMNLCTEVMRLAAGEHNNRAIC